MITTWVLSRLVVRPREEQRESRRRTYLGPMTLLLQLSSFLIAFSFPLTLFWFLVRKSSTLTVIAIISALFSLLSINLISSAWSLLPIRSWIFYTIVGAVTQELIRYVLVKLYRRVEQAVSSEVESWPERAAELSLNDRSSSIAVGFGFGLFRTLILSGSVIAGSGGEATLYMDNTCPHLPLVLVSAFFGLAFFTLDIIFTMILFNAERKKNTLAIFFVLLLHSAAALATTFGCLKSLPLVATAVTIALLFSRRLLRAKDFDGEYNFR